MEFRFINFAGQELILGLNFMLLTLWLLFIPVLNLAAYYFYERSKVFYHIAEIIMALTFKSKRKAVLLEIAFLIFVFDLILIVGMLFGWFGDYDSRLVQIVGEAS